MWMKPHQAESHRPLTRVDSLPSVLHLLSFMSSPVLTPATHSVWYQETEWKVDIFFQHLQSTYPFTVITIIRSVHHSYNTPLPWCLSHSAVIRNASCCYANLTCRWSDLINNSPLLPFVYGPVNWFTLTHLLIPHSNFCCAECVCYAHRRVFSSSSSSFYCLLFWFARTSQ